jgi:hypothetical protein
MVNRGVWVAVLAIAAAGCTCRTSTLKGNVGELVVVTQVAGVEVLTRDATVAVPDVAMGEVGVSTVTLRNVGTAALTLTHATRAPGGDAFEFDLADGTVLDANASLDVSVRFAPPQATDASLASVATSAAFTLALTGVASDAASATLTLTGNGLGRDCYVPAHVDFGAVTPGLQVSIPFVLRNGRQVATTTTFGALAGANPDLFSLGAPGPVTVAGGASVEVATWFAPLVVGPASATLVVQRDPSCAPVTVQLTGTGQANSLTWAPAMLDFGAVPVGQTALTQTVTVQNGSNAVLALTDVMAGADFTVVGPNSVSPAGLAHLTVACRPQALGPITSALRFNLNTNPVTPVVVPMTCRGGGPRLSAPTSVDFTSIPFLTPGAIAATRRLTVLNVGTAPASVGDTSSNLVLGNHGQAPLLSAVLLDGVDTSEFEVSLPSNYPSVGVPAISGQNRIDLEVRFRPKSLGHKQVQLWLYSNDAVSPVTKVLVSASAVTALPCTGLGLAPTAVAFGDTPRGVTADRTLTFTNSGVDPCQVSGADLAAGSSFIFSVLDPYLITIAPGASESIRVRATVPGMTNPGDSFQGTVRVSTTDSAHPTMLVPVDLKVSSCFVVSPTQLDFGSTGLTCRSQDLGLIMYDTCGVPLTITSLAVSPGAPFRLTSTPAIPTGGLALAPGMPQAVSVAFVPGAVGAALGTLDVGLIEAGTPRVASIPLAGLGTATSHQTQSWVQGQGDVDILFVVDDSCSMADEQMALATNFNSFIQHAAATGANFHLGVTTTDIFAVNGALKGSPAWLTPATPNLNLAFAQRALVGTSGSGWEQPLEGLLRAVTPPQSVGLNAGFLRPDVPLAAVIVTDAQEQSPLPVDVYVSKLRAVKNNRADLVNVSVVGPFSQPSQTCLLDSYSDDGRYAQLLAETHGAKGDICTTNWAHDLDTIGSSVLGLQTRFPLAALPGNGTVTVTVDGQTATGWTIDAAGRSLTFATPPPTGAHLTAAFDTDCFAP